MKKIEELELRITALESRVRGGRPPTRLEEAKKYLKKRIRSALPVHQVVNGSGFTQALLAKARKELGYKVFIKEGVWYWGQD